MGFTFWNEWQKILTYFMIFTFFEMYLRLGVSNSRPTGLFRPAASFYVAHENIRLSLKKKHLCYFILYIIKVHINTTRFCFYLAFYLYAEIDFSVQTIRSGWSQDSHLFTLTEKGCALYRSDISLHVCAQKSSLLNLMLPFCGHAPAET